MKELNIRNRATAIILRNTGKEVLVIKRIVKSIEYIELPGGGVEQGENLEECLIRELQEELTITPLEWKKLKTTRETNTMDLITKRFYFIIHRYEGEIKRSPEMNKLEGFGNTYELSWFPVSILKNIDLADNEDLFKEILENII